MPVQTLTTWLGLPAFALASVMFLMTFRAAPARQALLTRAALTSFVVGALACTASLFGHGAADDTGTLLATCLAWLTIGAYVRWKLKPLGALVAPLVTLLLLVQSFAIPSLRGTGTPSAALAAVHVTAAVLGQTFAIGACAVSVFYLWSRNALKRRQLGQLPAQVPAIDKLERLLTLLLWSGFIFITAGLVTGALHVQQQGVLEGARLEAKVVWAIAVWLWYLATLIARNVLNHPGKRIAQMSLGGFALMAVAYFGMAFFRTPGSM